MAVTVTETAVREIHSIIRQQNLDPAKVRLRVGVKGGGCSGFSYLLDLTETERDNDEGWEYTYQLAAVGASLNGEAHAAGTGAGGTVAAGAGEGGAGEGGAGEGMVLRVICDPKSYLYLNGTVIDFKDEIMGRGFVFNNPNATSSCGCGSSFAV